MKQAKHRKDKPRQTKPEEHFKVGDCVWIHSLRRTGIVYREADERGQVGVMIQNEKVRINRKRLSLYIDKERLYPSGGYDMDIVFESKENRKKRHLMSRKYAADVEIILPPEDRR